MRIRIAHDTVYRYGAPIKSAIQLLRLTPRNHHGQFVADWQIHLQTEARMTRRDDWFGNITHSLTIDGPLTEIHVRVEGAVETDDQGGVVRGTVERFPPALFLRPTNLSASDPTIVDFAQGIAGGSENVLNRMHALMHAIHDLVTFDTGVTLVTTTGAEAFAAGHGVCQDLAHIFIGAARAVGVPARYVSGYLYKPGEAQQDASHAWAEAYIKDLGWVSFDPANAICATEGYVRVAVGLDYLDAAPIRGSFYGGSTESMDVRLRIDDARQAQA